MNEANVREDLEKAPFANERPCDGCGEVPTRSFYGQNRDIVQRTFYGSEPRYSFGLPPITFPINGKSTVRPVNLRQVLVTLSIFDPEGHAKILLIISTLLESQD